MLALMMMSSTGLGSKVRTKPTNAAMQLLSFRLCGTPLITTCMAQEKHGCR